MTLWAAWVIIAPLALFLIILTLVDIHDAKKRFREDIARRDRIIAEQEKKEMERLDRQAQKEMTDDAYFIPK